MNDSFINLHGDVSSFIFMADTNKEQICAGMLLIIDLIRSCHCQWKPWEFVPHALRLLKCISATSIAQSKIPRSGFKPECDNWCKINPFLSLSLSSYSTSYGLLFWDGGFLLYVLQTAMIYVTLGLFSISRTNHVSTSSALYWFVLKQYGNQRTIWTFVLTLLYFIQVLLHCYTLS